MPSGTTNPFADLAAAVANYLRRSLQPRREEVRALVREELRALLTDPALLRSLRNPLVGTAFPFAAGMACTTDVIPKLTGSGCGLTDSVMKESSGNIGIGTASPSYILELYRNANDTTSQIMINNPNNGNFARVGLVALRNGDNAFDLVNAAGETWLRSFHSVPLNFYTNDTFWMTLTAAGNVGIGTASPASKLHVAGGNIRSEYSGDIRNLVLNQLIGSYRRTAIGFNWQGAEQYFLGTDLRGDDEERNFFLYDSIQDRPLEIWISPRGSNDDDAAQIQAAIDLLEAKSPPGGVIHLAPGTFRIGSTITIQNDGIKLRGSGSGQPGLPDPGIPTTKLLWVGTSGGTVVSATGTDEDPINGIEISDVTIDGNGSSESNKAGFGLNLSFVHKSRFASFDVYNVHPDSGTGIKVFDSAWNLFERCSVYNGKDGMHLGGAGETNACHNTFIALNLQGVTGVGLRLGDSDNNCFYDCMTPGTAGIGVLFEKGSGSGATRSNYFHHLQAGGTVGLKIEQADSPLSSKNMIHGYDLENGETQPIAKKTDNSNADPADFLFWIDSAGDIHGGQFA